MNYLKKNTIYIYISEQLEENVKCYNQIKCYNWRSLWYSHNNRSVQLLGSRGSRTTPGRWPSWQGRASGRSTGQAATGLRGAVPPCQRRAGQWQQRVPPTAQSPSGKVISQGQPRNKTPNQETQEQSWDKPAAADGAWMEPHGWGSVGEGSRWGCSAQLTPISTLRSLTVSELRLNYFSSKFQYLCINFQESKLT